MWILDNQTSYAAERSWTRDKRGMHVWIVAVKATFDIAPNGKLTLANEQQPPALLPEYRGDANTTSLRFESDLLAVKPATDVLLDACAHAPRARPTPTVSVSLRVGDVAKSLIVHGLRVYHKSVGGLRTSSPKPFVTQPIVYEQAFGGRDLSHSDPQQHRIDMRNPIGKGFTLDAQVLEDQPAHTIEYPAGDPSKIGPAGYGPLTSFWSPRIERGGTYDSAWEKNKKPLLPDDYDDLTAMAAPDDQRPRRPLRGGETVLVENMTPEGRLVFQLPSIAPTFTTHIATRAEEHTARLTTVHLALEQMKLTLVWQTALPVRARDLEYLDCTVIREQPDRA